MSTAFVLGNGISRKGLDLERLRSHGSIYGCNALYRDFTPDFLIATDRPIATAIQQSGYALKNKFYTRRPLEGSGAHAVSKPYFGYSSGPIAAALAAEHQNTTVYLLGFDMGPIHNNGFNNIYAGTEFYKNSNSLPTFTGNWVKQIIHVAKDFPTVQFVRVYGETTAAVKDFETVENISSIQLPDFVKNFL